MFRFAILFVVFFSVLFGLEVLKPVDESVIVPFTTGVAHFSTWLIGIFDHDVVAMGKVIRSTTTNFGVSIERGCNGIEAVIILFAAIFAFPAPIRHKLAGFALGFVAIQGLNMVRIISLFYLGQWETGKCAGAQPCPTVWFDLFHLYLWQALIIIDALVVWLVWLRWLPKETLPPANLAAT